MSDKINKIILILPLMLLMLYTFWGINLVSAQENEKNIYFFWGVGCPHCKNVENSGILKEISNIEGVNVYSLEVYSNQKNRKKYIEFSERLGINQYQRGVPLLVIECNNKYSYLAGDTNIIYNLKYKIDSCNFDNNSDIKPDATPQDNYEVEKITLLSIILAAFVDSINPCAFGVLIFLLATILSIGSSKRALKYSLVYIVIIFLVYFFVGLGIMKVLVEFSKVTEYIIILSGLLVFAGGIIEIKDFFWYNKGISLRIPVSIKPTLERITKKATLPSVIFLGVIVALVELPCTGGIYLAVLNLMHLNKTFGISYLLLYNLVFVLPLVFIALLAYRGTKMEKIQNWIESNKKMMRLMTGIIMILLALYLLNSVYNFI